ncbi:MAG: ATP-binding protein [Clostridiales Family XIII bacterium]|jgi:SpoVK/Ycf46/Vps4 family AAA+-type ATPase|nr:ATP-binding protein [Clostridiales Family XIII bacterium]
MSRTDVIVKSFSDALKTNTVLNFTSNTSDLFIYGGHLVPIRRIIAEESEFQGIPAVYYSFERGIENIVTGNEDVLSELQDDRDNLRSPIEVITGIFRNLEREGAGRTTIIFDFAEHIMPCQGGIDEPSSSTIREYIVSRATTDSRWNNQGHQIILISRTDDIDSTVLQSIGIQSVSLRLPGVDERREAITIMGAATAKPPIVCSPEVDINQLANSTGGFTIDAISRLRKLTSRENPLKISDVVEFKVNLINEAAQGMLFVRTEDTDLNRDVAGMENVKKYVNDMKGKTLRLLLVGPPGTGKTYVSVAIAREMGVPAVSLSAVKDKWYGESERKLRRVISIIESMAPILVIVDECESQGFGERTNSRTESSETDNALRGILLEWLGDTGSNNGISLIGLSNKPELIDSAFAGSRLKVLPVLEADSPEEKASIAEKVAERANIQIDSTGIINAFSKANKKVSGRQIVGIIDEANIIANEVGKTTITEFEFTEALDNFLHPFGPREELQVLNALKYTSSRRYLPWIVENTSPAEYIRNILDDYGNIDQVKLEQRIRELIAIA